METPQRNAQLGYIKSIPDDMSGLFRDWYKQTAKNNLANEKDEKDNEQHYCLVCDGIIRKRNKDEATIEREWEQNKMRVAFLIKDQNQGKKGPWNDDARNWLIPMETDDTTEKKRRKTRNWNVSNKFLRNIAQTLWGITNSKPGNLMPNTGIYTHFDKIQKCFHEVPFALIECKKQGGKASIDDDTLSYYLETYKGLLYKELDILEPHIFVCTNERIYKFIQDYIKEYKYKGTDLTPVRSLKEGREFEPSILIHWPSKTIILCSYHPSARMTYEDFFDGVVAHYNAFAQSEDDYKKFYN